ncbi:MAG: hypothetical protein C0406_06485 [Sideroxydans sp.]|nr:hypothetical protein [Sideroxydans sp.]
MKKISLMKRCSLICGLLTLSATSFTATALPLDDVGLEYKTDGIVATIRMTSPVQYLRHFPEQNGNSLEIFYDRGQGVSSDEVWADNEVRKSPPSGLIPSFTVTTRDQKTKPKLVIEFSRDADFTVTAGKDNRSFLITIRPDRQQAAPVELPLLPAIAAEVVIPAGKVLTPEEANLFENNKQARALMVQGRDALAVKNNEAAVEAFNKLLMLPPNDFTEGGQEWVGVARQRAGQFDKAKTEYDLYLNLYPQSEGVPRVMQRLAALAGTKEADGIVEATEKKREATFMTFGSVSSHYYFGHSKIDSTQTFNNAAETQSLKLTDQNMMITTEDVVGRYVSDDYDGRLVFRGNNTLNFLSNKSNQNRLTAMYGEVKSRKQDYMLRVGRQSAYGGGVMGRFDGVAGSYGDAQQLRVNAVAGALADYSQGSTPTFFGASADMGDFSFYGINQSVGSVLDRRAIGTEWRYFQDKTTAFAMVDYDANFKALNAAQIMGTQGLSGINLNFMLDHRRTPSLSIRNALNGALTSNVSDLMQTMSASSLRQLALDRTATSNSAQVGATMPFAQKFQIGGDVRVSNTTGLPASSVVGTPLAGTLAAVPSRGAEKSVTGQVIGSSLYMEGDIWSASTTFSTSSAVNGHSIFFYNHTGFKSGWMMDTSMQLYRQTDQFGGVTTRTSPMVRGSYRLKDQWTFDVDGGIESTKNSGAQVNTSTLRFFTSAGVRWDF